MGHIILVLCGVFFYSSVAQAQVLFHDTTNSAGGPFHSGETWGASWGYLNDDLYPDLFSNNHGMRNGVLLNNGDGTFSDVLDQVDLDNVWVPDPFADIHGGSWADFDNDGDQDLIVTRSSSGAQIYLMKNNGLGQFTEEAQQHAIRGYGGGRMPLLFDYTGDGNLDLSLARNRSGGMHIFRWDPATNKFENQSSETGITDQCNRNTTGFVTDLFNTGSLHYLCLSETRVPERVYDTSTIPFTDETNKVDHIGTVPDAVLADLNGDLLQDIVGLRGRIRPSTVERVSSNRIEAWLSVGGTVDFEKSFTFKATGPITINVYARYVGEPSGVKIGASGYNPSSLPFTLDPADSANWGTVSDHNQYSVFAGYDEINQEWTIYLSAGGNGSGEGAYFTVSGNDLTEPTATGLQVPDGPLQPKFLLNDGGRLVDSGARGIGAVSCGGLTAADFDNDMDIDLYLACRTGTANIANRLYLNDGNGTFSLAPGTHGAEGLIGAGIDGLMGSAEMAITADYDLDGFVDLFVTNGNRLFPHFVKDDFSAGGPVRFYRNLGNANHWLEFDLKGTTSNRDGFGAKIIVTAGDQSQVREQNGMYHRWSHDDRRLHFGLASYTTADVRVEWPDGSVDEYSDVAADQLYLATQNESLTALDTSLNSLPTISVNSVQVSESTNNAMLTVSLSEPQASNVSVSFETQDGTAIGGSDYVARNLTTMTFSPGQTIKNRYVQIIKDTQAENGETFVFQLSNPVGATFLESTAVIDILDDDLADSSDVCGAPSFSSSSEKGLFVWKDCVGTGDWFMRATAGGGIATTYDGTLLSDTQFVTVSDFSFEGIDNVQLSNSDMQLDFLMKMSNSGVDGLDLSLGSPSELCLTLAASDQTIFIGSTKIAFASSAPLNLLAPGNNCDGP